GEQFAKDWQIAGENGLAQGKSGRKRTTGCDRAIGIDHHVGSAIEGNQFFAGDEAQVQLHQLQTELADLFANLLRNLMRSCAHDQQADIFIVGFNLLPCLQQQVDALVGEDDSLPQDQQLSRLETEASHGLLGVGCGKIVEEWPVRNEGYLLFRHVELFLEPCLDTVGVADDTVNHLVQVAEGLLVLLPGVVRKQIVNRQHDLRAASAAQLYEPEVEWETRQQHGQELHMNDLGGRDEEAHGKRGQIEVRLQQLEDSARQARQPKPSDDVEKARMKLDSPT